MSNFHPAVYSALYVAVREHEVSKASAESVADLYDTSESIAYHDEVIASLKELIAVLHAEAIDTAIDDRLIAEDDARRLDEDQPSEARGHGHARVCHAMMPDGTWAARCGAGDRVSISMLQVNVTCIGCLTLCAEQERWDSEEAAEDAATPSAAPTADDPYTDEQLDGTACSSCGRDFADGERTRPTLRFSGHQLFRHEPSCPLIAPPAATGDPS